MKKLHIIIKDTKKEYSIIIGKNILEKIAEVIDFTQYSKFFVITDDIVAPIFLQKLLASLPKDTHSIILPTGENEKNIENAQKIWTSMYKAKLDRKSLVINLGGGVIGDIGGFAAATYMRGTHFINIPTTLLSQIDESVGGKTMINFANIKNLIGVFYQPSAVMIDIQILDTLPKRQFLSGFAEIIKHGLITDKAYFEKVTSKKPSDFSQDELIDIIVGSCEIKKAIVESDETETGQRKLINVGHTIGHAIEALSFDTDKPLLHGEAVSIGTVAEAKIAEMTSILSSKDFQTIEKSFLDAGLPVSTFNIKPDQIIQKMQSDKKNIGGKINFTLLSSIGKAIINQDNISDDIIKNALHYILK